MSGGSKTIKLLCPLVSKLVPLVVLEDHGVDLGSIARIFGLDPSSLRLNGHFVSSSRGLDFISSVTWKSLLSFFSSRGFPNGGNHTNPLLVEGKLSDTESSGPQNPSNNSGDVDLQTTEDESLGSKRKPQLDDVKLIKKRKMDQCNSGKSSNPSSTIPTILSTQFTFSCFNGNLKRQREDEMILIATPSKRNG
ncbi:amino acid-ligase [Tasmannia lanceolata]|uniref:amino acid-ligase n=1 Tax=Tasmannia lanceolata TaxID=3420 RepID=UPI0040640B3C